MFLHCVTQKALSSVLNTQVSIFAKIGKTSYLQQNTLQQKNKLYNLINLIKNADRGP